MKTRNELLPEPGSKGEAGDQGNVDGGRSSSAATRATPAERTPLPLSRYAHYYSSASTLIYYLGVRPSPLVIPGTFRTVFTLRDRV